MPRRVAMLSLTTAALGIGGLYLVYRIHDQAPAATSPPAEVRATADPQGPPPSATAVSGAGAQGNRLSQRPSGPDGDAEAAEIAAQRAELDDPATRDKVRDRMVALYSSNTPHGFTGFVGLRDDEYARLMNLLTDHQLELVKARHECAVQPGCDDLHVMQTMLPEQRRALVEMLGAGRAQRLDQFLDNLTVGSSVANLRSLLPESQPLADAQADKLVEALGDERRRIIREIEQRGTTYTSISSMRGNVIVSAASESPEQKFDEAQAYQRRMNGVAARFLTGPQLGVFRKMQEAWLAEWHQRWQSESAGREPR